MKNVIHLDFGTTFRKVRDSKQEVSIKNSGKWAYSLFNQFRAGGGIPALSTVKNK